MAQEWAAQLLRLTTFSLPTSSDSLPDVNQWWLDLVGEEPDQLNFQPRARLYHVESAFSTGKLILSHRPERTDWILQAQALDSIPEGKLSSFDDALEVFLPLAELWMDYAHTPEVTRLALGAVLMNSVESKVKGYENLDTLLPSLKVDSTGSSDLLYRINRPRKTKLLNGEVEVNRVSTWSVGTTIGINVGVPFARQELLGFATRLEMDINTAPEIMGLYKGSELKPLLHTFVDMAIEISREGDIA